MESALYESKCNLLNICFNLSDDFSTCFSLVPSGVTEPGPTRAGDRATQNFLFFKYNYNYIFLIF